MSEYNQNEPMIEMYVYETTQLIDRLEQLMMASEKEENLDFAIDEIFRIMHTIKGNSMMMMYEGIAVIAHRNEDLFDFLRNNKALKYDPSRITDLTLAMIDFVKEEVKKLEMGGQQNGEANDLRDEIVTYLESLKFMNDKEQYSPDESNAVKPQYYISPQKIDLKEEPTSSKGNEQLNYFRLKIEYELDCGMENIRAFTFVHSIKDKVVDLIHIPLDITNDPDAADYIVKNGFKAYIKTEMTTEEVQEIIRGISFLKNYDLLEINEMAFNEAFISAEAGIIPADGEAESSPDLVDEAVEIKASEDDHDAFNKVSFEASELGETPEDTEGETLNKLNAEISREKKPIKQPVQEVPKTESDGKKVVKQNFNSVEVYRVDKLMDLV